MILGLFGEAGSGKDTVADLIQKILHDARVKRTSFAGPVYALAAALVGTTVEDLANRDSKEKFRFMSICNNRIEEFVELAASYGMSRDDVLFAVPDFIEILVENFNSPHEIVDRTDGLETPLLVAELYISPRKLLEFVGTEFGRNMLGENVWLDLVKAQGAKNPDSILIVTDVRFPNEVRVIDYLVEIIAPDNKFRIESTHASAAGIPSRLRNDLIINNQNGLSELEENVHIMLRNLATKGLV